MIRSATLADGPALANLYNWYITNTVITFEEEVVSGGDMAQRIVVADATRPWFVLEEEGELVGYAYAEKWRSRSAYRNTRETSVYIDYRRLRQGQGRQLYECLIDSLRPTPVHALIAGIALPNDSSIGFHEAMGFEKVGQFREVGFKLGRFIDVGYWQLLLD